MRPEIEKAMADTTTALDTMLRASDELHDAIHAGVRATKDLVRATWEFHRAAWKLRQASYVEIFGDR